MKTELRRLTRFVAIRAGGAALLVAIAAGAAAAAENNAKLPEDKNDPAAELASFKVAEGFEVNLFASEKDGIVNPISMRWDALGRLWVIGSQTYPQLKPGEQPNDKVWIVDDSNKDGKADHVTVFADGLMIPTGIEIAPPPQSRFAGASATPNEPAATIQFPKLAMDDLKGALSSSSPEEAQIARRRLAGALATLDDPDATIRVPNLTIEDPTVALNNPAPEAAQIAATVAVVYQTQRSAVYVGEGTKLWLMTDRDGDGKMDEKEVVFRGFGTGDNHQNLNSFRWSPGGELMFCQGLHANARIETPHGIVGLDEAGLWRMRPREMRLDAFYGGQADPQNPWGWVFTDFGQPLVAAGNNGTYFYPLPEMIRGVQGGRRDNIWQEGRGRKTSNPDIVGTAHFPAEWQGTLIAGGYMNNAIWALKVEDDGAGFGLVDREPLLTSTHSSFRPVDVKFGPDGALYICDWYNPVIGHYQASFRHPARDKSHGRIWRITAKGRPLVQPPQISGAPIPQLLENLRSDDRWVRYATKIELGGRASEEVVKELRSWWPRVASEAAAERKPELARTLVEALGTFEWHETTEPPLLKTLLSSPEAGARAYAAGTLARWADRLPVEFEVMEKLAELAHDSDARVRLAAIVAAGNIPRPESVVVVLSAADQPRDKFIDLALKSAMRVLKPFRERALASGKPHWPELLAKISSGAPAGPAAAKTSPSSAAPAVQTTFAPDTVIAPFGKYRATPDFVASLTAEVKELGSAKAGAEIYQRIGCAACHAIGGQGGNIGPALDSFGAGHPIDFIVGAVIEPQREVKEGFETYAITTKDGATFSGYFVAGTEEERTLRDLASGKEVKIRGDQIAKREFRGSVMPANLTDSLTREELRDLVRFLSELGKQP